MPAENDRIDRINYESESTVRKSFFPPTLIITLILVIMFIAIHVMVAQAQSITVDRGVRIESGYAVQGHPQFHTALFNSEPLANTEPHLWAVFSIIIISLGIVCIVLIGRMRRDRREEKRNWSIVSLDSEKIEAADEEEVFLKLKHQNDKLLTEIKSLDAQFASGEIPEKQYQDLRKQKKEMLVRVKIKIKDLIDS